MLDFGFLPSKGSPMRPTNLGSKSSIQRIDHDVKRKRNAIIKDGRTSGILSGVQVLLGVFDIHKDPWSI